MTDTNQAKGGDSGGLIGQIRKALALLNLPKGDDDWPASFALLVFVVFVLLLAVLLLPTDLFELSWTSLRSWVSRVDVFVGLILLAYIIMVMLYCLSEGWNQLFDTLYSVDSGTEVPEQSPKPLANRPGEGLLTRTDRRPGEFLFLIPGGRDLHVVRIQAARTLRFKYFGGLYAKCYEMINESDNPKVKSIRDMQVRSRLCRALILPVLLCGFGVAWTARGGHGLGCPQSLPLGLMWAFTVVGLTVAFINQRVANATAVYGLAVDLKNSDIQPPTLDDEGGSRLLRTLPRVFGVTLVLGCLFAAALWPCLPISRASGATPKSTATEDAPTISFEYSGKISPFDVGQHDKLAAEADKVLSRVVRCLSERAKSRPLLQLVLVGSADKFELASALRSRYGSNAGLARARADWVAEEITRRWPDPRVPVSQPLALTVGPGQVGKTLSPAQTGDDRSVAIHAVWGKEKTMAKENAGSQLDVECAAAS